MLFNVKMLTLYGIAYGIGVKRRLDFRVEDYEFSFPETYCKELGIL